jgi:hypothetical protein
MTDDERFELELATLRPRGPSAELRQRIAEDFAATPRRDVIQARRLWQSWAVLGGLLAASLVAAIVWRGGGRAVDLQSTPALESNVAMPFDETAPSVWYYRSALARSSHTLDELLSRHAAQTLEHKPGGAPDLLAARFNSDLDSFWGEL